MTRKITVVTMTADGELDVVATYAGWRNDAAYRAAREYLDASEMSTAHGGAGYTLRDGYSSGTVEVIEADDMEFTQHFSRITALPRKRTNRTVD